MKRLCPAIIILICFLCGCDKISEIKFPGSEIIDYGTGAEQIRTYKRTRSQVDDINKKLKKRYEVDYEN